MNHVISCITLLFCSSVISMEQTAPRVKYSFNRVKNLRTLCAETIIDSPSINLSEVLITLAPHLLQSQKFFTDLALEIIESKHTGNILPYDEKIAPAINCLFKYLVAREKIQDRFDDQFDFYAQQQKDQGIPSEKQQDALNKDFAQQFSPHELVVSEATNNHTSFIFSNPYLQSSDCLKILARPTNELTNEGPVFHTVQINQGKYIEKILRAGTFTLLTKKNETVLHVALNRGKYTSNLLLVLLNTAKKCLSEKEFCAFINHRDNNGNSALYKAITLDCWHIYRLSLDTIFIPQLISNNAWDLRSLIATATIDYKNSGDTSTSTILFNNKPKEFDKFKKETFKEFIQLIGLMKAYEGISFINERNLTNLSCDL